MFQLCEDNAKHPFKVDHDPQAPKVHRLSEHAVLAQPKKTQRPVYTCALCKNVNSFTSDAQIYAHLGGKKHRKAE